MILGTLNELVTPKFFLNAIEHDSLGFPVGQPGGEKAPVELYCGEDSIARLVVTVTSEMFLTQEIPTEEISSSLVLSFTSVETGEETRYVFLLVFTYVEVAPVLSTPPSAFLSIEFTGEDVQTIEPLGSTMTAAEGSFILLGTEFDTAGFDQYGT